MKIFKINKLVRQKLVHCLLIIAFFMPHTTAYAEEFTTPSGNVLRERLAEFQEIKPRSLIEFQPFRAEKKAFGPNGSTISLLSLNPKFNTWFILEVSSGSQVERYHLELAEPQNTTLTLQGGGTVNLVFGNDSSATLCSPWLGPNDELSEARNTGLPYAPICNRLAFLRNKVRGNRSNREAVAEFLRDNITFGESLVGLIKGSFYEDAYMNSGEVVDGGDAGGIVASLGKAKLSDDPILKTNFGFELDGASEGVAAGSWYAIKEVPGVYASVMQPGMISQEILNTPGANRLDTVERRAEVYLIAFDLSQFKLGYELGTDHPRLGWSPRPAAIIDQRLPGPDGFKKAAPMVRSGMLSPSLTANIAATFSAGFKRDHGAWRSGDKALSRGGHHYGFMQQGVIFSRLQPGLATIFILDDGSIHMRSWRDMDNSLLPRVKFARQNGVPLIEKDVLGENVTSWMGGNWHGSADTELRTLRGGACLKTVDDRQFFIYAYFSTATPSAMARSFQAYECEYAMLLDMNSQEHTYLAIYNHDNGRVFPKHLVRGMSALDSETSDGWPIPRFVSFADNRDFFYLLRK